jgi:hypothetical protein
MLHEGREMQNPRLCCYLVAADCIFLGQERGNMMVIKGVGEAGFVDEKCRVVGFKDRIYSLRDGKAMFSVES